MISSFKEFSALLAEKLDTYDKTGAEAVCDALVNYLYGSEEPVSATDAEKAMQRLRNKRMFLAMQKLGDALIQTGRHTYKIRRLYAQALIDQNNLTAAISILNELKSDTANASVKDKDALKENIEARGLIGRTYKQLYVNAKNSGSVQNAFFLKQSIQAYLDVYTSSPGDWTWYGINVVALLKRAQADKIDVTGFPVAETLATSILKTMEEKHADQRADAWDFATAAEACIALGKPADALKWLSGYARMPYADAFELASTLRQLEEVWQLDMSSETGKLLLPLLRAELLKREDGNVVINTHQLQQQKAAQKSTTDKYEDLAKQTEDGASIKLEKVFGKDSYQNYQWYMKGADRCLAVARIGKDSSKGFGSGFLLEGDVLHGKLKGELVLLTNAHVISNDPAEKSLKSDEAVIIFELLDREQEFKVSEILWSSASNELDVTIIRFDRKDLPRLRELTKGINFYPLARKLPVVNKEMTQRVYIIGHPFGGGLQLSFQDNTVLDYDSQRIHYRTPTASGSSGSPIFNEQWELIGIHHKGSRILPRLHNKQGAYEANEGILMEAIKDRLGNELVMNEDGTPEYFMKKGNSYASARHYDEALKTYTEGYDRFPETYEFLKRIADVFNLMGEVNKYLENLERYNNEKNRVTLENNLKRKLVVNYFSTNNHPFYGDLVWPVNPRMNILLGKNGYGKSHLLTVMLALLQNNYKKTLEFSTSGANLAITINSDDISSLSDLEKLPAETEKLSTGTDSIEEEDKATVVSFSARGLDSVIGKIPVLSIPDFRYIDKSVNLVSRPKEAFNILHDSALHSLHQMPYGDVIENALFRVCQVYSERTNKEEPLSVVKLVEEIFYRLTGGYFTINKIESTPSTQYEVLVNTEGAEKLPIQKVSQGTFSIISITLIIFNYLRARYPDVQDDEVKHQHAIVFIDEIDAHLHPSWQQKIIGILRETFPQVQFFITGHSPLIVAGCRIGEVAVLRKATSGFKLEFAEHDFIGYQVGELYKQIFEIESYDETYLKYNSLLPFKEDYEKQIEVLSSKDDRTEEESGRLESLCNDVYYMNVVAQKNNEK